MALTCTVTANLYATYALAVAAMNGTVLPGDKDELNLYVVPGGTRGVNFLVVKILKA